MTQLRSENISKIIESKGYEKEPWNSDWTQLSLFDMDQQGDTYVHLTLYDQVKDASALVRIRILLLKVRLADLEKKTSAAVRLLSRIKKSSAGDVVPMENYTRKDSVENKARCEMLTMQWLAIVKNEDIPSDSLVPLDVKAVERKLKQFIFADAHGRTDQNENEFDLVRSSDLLTKMYHGSENDHFQFGRDSTLALLCFSLDRTENKTISDFLSTIKISDDFTMDDSQEQEYCGNDVEFFYDQMSVSESEETSSPLELNSDQEDRTIKMDIDIPHEEETPIFNTKITKPKKPDRKRKYNLVNIIQDPKIKQEQSTPSKKRRTKKIKKRKKALISILLSSNFEKFLIDPDFANKIDQFDELFHTETLVNQDITIEERDIGFAFSPPDNLDYTAPTQNILKSTKNIQQMISNSSSITLSDIHIQSNQIQSIQRTYIQTLLAINTHNTQSGTNQKKIISTPPTLTIKTHSSIKKYQS